MADWIIDTNSGSFEGRKCKEVIKDMIEYFAREEDTPIITRINYYPSASREKELCKSAVRNIQCYFETQVEQWRRDIVIEYRGQRAIESDYREAIL